MCFLQYVTYCQEGKISYDMLLNFFSQETILSVRLHLINTKRCRQQPEPGPFFPLFSARWFAYENRIHWLCGQAYANRAGSSSVPGRLFHFSRPGGLRTKTEFIGFAGRRTQTVPAAARSRAAFSTFPGPVVCVRKPNLLALRAGVRKPCRQQPGPGPLFSFFSARWFAYENRIHWLCGQAYANRAGSCPVPGRFFRFSRPGGLRTKIDFIGFAGRRTQTDLRTCRCLCWRHKTKRAAADNFSAAALLIFNNS